MNKCCRVFGIDQSTAQVCTFYVTGNKNGNRRTANIRSVGYSDLFVLSKEDLWEALKEYPESKRTLTEKGRQMLRKDNLLDEELANALDVAGSTEERTEQVERTVERARTRLARLMAEVTATTNRLHQRLADLDAQLDRLTRSDNPAAFNNNVTCQQIDMY
jgi:predicted RecB family endonuclease